MLQFALLDKKEAVVPKQKALSQPNQEAQDISISRLPSLVVSKANSLNSQGNPHYSEYNLENISGSKRVASDATSFSSSAFFTQRSTNSPSLAPVPPVHDPLEGLALSQLNDHSTLLPHIDDVKTREALIERCHAYHATGLHQSALDDLNTLFNAGVDTPELRTMRASVYLKLALKDIKALGHDAEALCASIEQAQTQLIDHENEVNSSSSRSSQPDQCQSAAPKATAFGLKASC